jgi:hypothetical protein
MRRRSALPARQLPRVLFRALDSVEAEMPSRSLHLWQTVRRAALDQIAAAHTAVGGAAPGRRYATQQINQAYAMLLSSQNPNPGNLGSDFGFFDLELWSALRAHDNANAARNKLLERLNDWRNAIAHQDFKPAKLGGRTTVRLTDVRQWRHTCDRLAIDMDVVVGAHVGTILGAKPW